MSPAQPERNWASYGESVEPAPGIEEWQRKLLCDPQTSGGLLVACAPNSAEEVLALFHRHGFAQAAEIGGLHAGMDVSVVA